MNELSQIQLIGASAAFSVAFFLLLYVAKKMFKAELKGDWGLVAMGAFPFLVYAVLSILSADLLKKEIGLSVGVVNVKLIKDSTATRGPHFSFDRDVQADARSSLKETGRQAEDIIADARRKELGSLLVDADKYKIDLYLVDKYASKSGYLFKHVVFVEGKRFLGYATPHDIDWYLKSDEFDKSRDFYSHLRAMSVQTDVVYNTTSEQEALAIMENRGIEIIAVLDSRTGNYKGLASRQQIAENMLAQLFAQIGKVKTAEIAPAKDDTSAALKTIQEEIKELSRLQSQQLGLLQGLLPAISYHALEGRQRTTLDIESDATPMEQHSIQQQSAPDLQQDQYVR